MAVIEPVQTSKTRRKLFERAAELFAARGYDAVSVREIVEACGVTKPALYYHFESKEGLARALIEDFFDEAARLRDAALAEKDLHSALLLYARGKIRLAQQRRGTLAFTFSIWFGRSSLREIFEDCRQRHEDSMRQWAESFMRYGLTETAAHRVLKAFWGLLMHRLIMILQCPKWTGDAEAEAQEVVAVVTEGALTPRPVRASGHLRGLAILVLLAALAVIAGCGQGAGAQAATTRETPARNVTARILETEKLVVSLRLPGVAVPRETIELRAAASGEILRLDFKEGELVPASPSPYLTTNLDRDVRPFARINDSDIQTLISARTLVLEQARRDYKRVMEYADSTPQQRDRAKTELDAADFSLKAAQKMLRDTYVVSPQQGILRRRLRQRGEFVNMGELIGIVDVLNPMVFTLEIPEAHVGRVKKGDELDVEFSALRDGGAALRRKGRISLVDRVASANTHTFRVELELDNGDGRLLAGVFGVIHLTTYERADALVVPFQAIKLEGEDEVAFVVADGKAQRRKIRRGVMTGNRFEILEGLKAGEVVVSVGAQSLNDGDRVVLREDPTAIMK